MVTCMKNRYPRISSLSLCLALAGLLTTTFSLNAQDRDFHAERIVLDDDGAGGFNTLTLQVPPGGLSADRTLTLPDADGSIVTLAAPLLPNQILFGGPGGQIVQSPNLLWNEGAVLFDLGGGQFIVDLGLQQMQMPGILQMDLGVGQFVVDLGLQQMQMPGILQMDLGGGGFIVDLGLQQMQMPGVIDVNPASLDYGGGGIFNVDAAGNTLMDGSLTVNGDGSSIGTGVNATLLTILGVDGGATELQVNGDVDITGALSVGTLMLNGDLDMDDNDVFNIDEIRGNSATGDLNVNSTNTGDINLGNGTGDVNVDANVIPSADNTYALGSDALRWADVYVNGGSMHIGPAGGEGSTEMVLGYIGGNTGTINVNSAGAAQFAINGGTNVVTIDPDGGGGAELVVNAAAGEVSVNDDLNVAGDVVVTGGDIDTDQDMVAGGSITAGVDLEAGGEFFLGDGDAGDIMTIDNGGTELEMSASGIDRSSGAQETFDIDNSGGGDMTVRINGAGTVTNSRLTIDDGHWTSQQTTGPVGAVAGANVTSAVMANHTDVAGIVDITTSGAPAAGAQATVTFDAAYGTAPIVVLTAANGPAVGVGAYVTRTTGGFTINFIGVPAATTSYQYFYQVIETQ